MPSGPEQTPTTRGRLSEALARLTLLLYAVRTLKQGHIDLAAWHRQEGCRLMAWWHEWRLARLYRREWRIVLKRAPIEHDLVWFDILRKRDPQGPQGP